MAHSGAEAKIVEEYRTRGRMEGKELLLRQREALEFIADCLRRRLVIIGMDFFIGRGDHLVLLNNSGVFEGWLGHPDAVEQTARAARVLIQDGLPDGADWVTFDVEEAR